MRSFFFTVVATALLGLSGCMLNRTPLIDEDAGAEPDVPGLDAPRADVPGLDAPVPDVPGLDAPIPGDVPTLDTPSDSGVCVRTTSGELEVACDRIDDECDGVIDDDDVCGCDAFTVAGRAYLSCPPVTGLDAWSGACGKTAPGYDLVVFSSVEQAQVLSAIGDLGISEPHWIGLNDFEENSTYVWRDHSTAFTPTSVMADDPAKRFVIVRDDGRYDELTGSESSRLLCEAVVPPGMCRSTTESAVCDGIDDDCNGVADDGLNCGAMCMAQVFWDSVYYVCESATAHAPSQSLCSGLGSSLVVLNSNTERSFLNAATGEVWIGLTQAISTPSTSTTFENWSWIGAPTVTYGIPSGTGMPPWDSGGGGQPDDIMPPETNAQNCASMRADGDFEDDGCLELHQFVCERPWTY